MRKQFATTLLRMMREDESIYLLTADLGYGIFDEIRDTFPERFINTQAAEQAMILCAVGLAQEGKRPFCYSITPFLLHRPYEAIKLYIEGEKANVVLVGSGRGRDYYHDGLSHWDTGFMFSMRTFYPDNAEEIVNYLPKFRAPYYINLKR